MRRESPAVGKLRRCHPLCGNLEEIVRQGTASLGQRGPPKKVGCSLQGRGSDWGKEELLKLLGDEEEEGGCAWWPCS